MANALAASQSLGPLPHEGTSIHVTSKGLLLYLAEPSKGVQLTFELDPSDIRTFPLTLVAEGSDEPVLSELLFAFVKESNTFVDIGANIGFYTVAAARINDNLRVISYEPNPLVFSKLRHNLNLNNCLQNASIRNLALSNEVKGSVEFYIPKFTGSGAGSMSNLHPEEGDPLIQTVSTTRLDDDLQDSTEVDVLKIDVEGSEFQVLQGSMKQIDRSHPTIVMELLRKRMSPSGYHPQDVIEFLMDRGYSAFAIADFGCEPILKVTEETVATNFVFCHPSRPNHFSTAKAMS